MAHTLPLTNCEPGTPCACGRTFTLTTELWRTHQRFVYGSTKWAADYGRRSAVESLNAALKKHYGSLRRGSTQVFGLVKNTVFVGMLIAATNLRITASRYGIDPTDNPPGPFTLPVVPGAKEALHRRLFRPGRSPDAT